MQVSGELGTASYPIPALAVEKVLLQTLRWLEWAFCVRWYLTYQLRSRNLVQMMAERGIAVTRTTTLRWVLCFVPEFEHRRSQYPQPVGWSWRCDET
jgi:hypothetical protein